MSKNQRLYLRDILEHIARIEETARQGEATFRQSYMHQDTIIRSFEVIGEIIKRLEPTLLAQQPHIQWADYAGFRDILIHQYDKVLLDIVWESAQSDLAPLRAVVEALLASLPPNELMDGT